MQNGSPHDESARWLVTLFVSLFAGGVGWLVKHLAGRRSEYVQLGLARAQRLEIKARIRRDDESAAVSGLKALADALRVDVERLRQERDAADVRVGQLLIERRERDEKIDLLTEQLRVAEEELGLKARSERDGA